MWRDPSWVSWQCVSRNKDQDCRLLRKLEPPDLSAISIRSELEASGLLSEDIWQEARTFLALAKAGTLAGAARKLGVSTLTMSRSVRRLQDRLGAGLFVTSNRGITLTKKGEELTNVLLLVDKHLYSVAVELRSESSDLRGAVRISVTEGLAVAFLVPALREFGRKYPKIETIIKAPISKESIRKNQTDIMVGFMFDQSKDVTSRSLGMHHLIPCAARSYIQRRGLPDLTNLRDHDFVESEQYGREAQLWVSWHKLIDQGTCAHRPDTSIVYATMVREGLGIGLLSNFATSDPELVRLALPAHVAVPIFASALTDRLQSKPVRTVYDFVSKLFGPDNVWFLTNTSSAPMGDRRRPSSFDLWD